EKKECSRAKAQLEHLRRQQPNAVYTPTSAEQFTQRVLELATLQQNLERRQREQRASLASSGGNMSLEQSNLSSNSKAHGNGPSNWVAGTEIISVRRRSSSSSATRRSSPPALTQRRSPAGSVPTALFRDPPGHQRCTICGASHLRRRRSDP